MVWVGLTLAAHALVCVHRRIGVTLAVQETDWMFALFWTLGIFDAGVIQDGLWWLYRAETGLYECI